MHNIKDILDVLSGKGDIRSDIGTMPALCELLPYRYYEDGIFYNDDSQGFIIEFSPLYGHISQQEEESISKLLSNGLEDETTVQIYRWENSKSGYWIQNWAKQRLMTETDNQILKKMSEKREQFFENAHKDSLFDDVPFYIRDVRCFIAVSIPNKKGTVELSKTRFFEALKTISSFVRLLSPLEFITLVDEWIHPDFSSTHKPLAYDEFTPIHHQLMDGNEFLNTKKDTLCFENMNAAVLTVEDLPLKWASYLVGFLNGDEHNTYSRYTAPTLSVFNFTALKEHSAKLKANVKTQELASDMKKGVHKYIPDIADQRDEWDFVKRKLSDGGKLVRAFQTVIVFDTPNRLDDSVETIKKIYSERAWVLKRERYGQLTGFLYCLPFMPATGMESDFKRMGRLKTRLTNTCSHLMNIYGDLKGTTNEPFLYLLGRHGQPGFWSPFNSNSNFNISITGQPGAGKSVTMQEIIAAVLAFNGEAIVIDDGFSFKTSVDLLGGDHIVVKGDISINPFSMIDIEDAKDEEYLNENLLLIENMIGHMARPQAYATDEEVVRIKSAIRTVWKDKQNGATITDVAKVLSTYKLENKKVCAIASELSRLLAPYCDGGEMGKFFNRPHTLNIKNSYTVYEMSVVNDNPILQGLVLMMIIFMVSIKMYHGDRSIRKCIAVDEAWNLLSHKAAAKFIEGIARRARKYNAFLLTGTQSLDDFTEGPAKAAWDASYWRIIMNQSGSAIDNATTGDNKILQLSPYGVEQAKSIRTHKGRFSEMLIVPSDQQSGFVARLPLDPYSVCLYSSDATDVATMERMQKKQGVTLAEAVEIFAEEKGRTS